MSKIKKIKVDCAGGKYLILIGSGLLNRIGALAKPILRPGAKVLVVYNTRGVRYRKNFNQVAQSLRKAGFQTYSCRLKRGTEDDKSVNNLFKLWSSFFLYLLYSYLRDV